MSVSAENTHKVSRIRRHKKAFAHPCRDPKTAIEYTGGCCEMCAVASARDCQKIHGVVAVRIWPYTQIIRTAVPDIIRDSAENIAAIA